MFSPLTSQERNALKRAKSLLSLDKSGFILSVFAGVLGLGSALALAATSAWLIARASQMPPVLSLGVAATGVRAFGVGKAVFRYVERLSSHSVAIRGMASLRTRIYLTLARAKNDQLTSLRRGDILSRTGQDVDAVGDYVIKGVLPGWVALIVSLIAIIVVGSLHLGAGLVLAICIFVAGVITPVLSARAARISQQAMDKARIEFSALSLSMLENSSELQVSGAMTIAQRELQNIESTLQHAKDTAAKPMAIATAIDNLCMGIAVLGAIILGIPAVDSGSLSQVDLAVIVITPLAAFEPTSVLGMAVVQKVRSAVSAQRILHLLDMSTHNQLETSTPSQKSSSNHNSVNLFDEQTIAYASSKTSTLGQDIFRPEQNRPVYATSTKEDLEIPADPAQADHLPTKIFSTDYTQASSLSDDEATNKKQLLHLPSDLPLLKIEKVDVGWPGAKPLLKTLNLSLYPGESLAIVGASGVGKTTIMHTIAGLLPVKAGIVHLMGKDMESMSRLEICKYAVYTAEDAHIFSTSVLENIRVSNGNLTPDEAYSVLHKAGLGSWINTLDKGLHTQITENGANISGGERRRLLLARALSSPAQLLLLDEPGEHIEPKIADELVIEMLRLTDKNKAIVLITHRLHPLAQANRVMMIRKGQPPILGTHAQLIKESAQYAWALAQEEDYDVSSTSLDRTDNG